MEIRFPVKVNAKYFAGFSKFSTKVERQEFDKRQAPNEMEAITGLDFAADRCIKSVEQSSKCDRFPIYVCITRNMDIGID